MTGLNQEEFAREAGISLPTLRRVEDGRNVTTDTITKFVSALEKNGVETTLPASNFGPGVRWRSTEGKPKKPEHK